MIRGLVALALASASSAAGAQHHGGGHGGGHGAMASPAAPVPAAQSHHADHGMMPPPAASPREGRAAAGDPASSVAAGTDLPPGSAPAPAPPSDHWNDRHWPAAAMAESRARLAREHGGMAVSQVMLNILEAQPRGGRNGYRWDGEGWFGGDLHRLTIKSEGEGRFGGGADEAEAQLLYSRALDAYWNLQAGARRDLRRAGPRRTYAVVGVEGLAPYWFEVEGALFLSGKGDLFGRIEAYYDQRITQRLILQPRAELEFAAQDVRENGIGRGLSEMALDLRLRYEVRREFAPYVGLGHERRFARARDHAAAGGGRGGTRLMLGARAWF